MMSSIAEQLFEQERLVGRSLRLAPPPECEHLLALARAHGVNVRQLFVVSQPLRAGRRGSWDNAVCDMWVWHQGDDCLARTLLTELHELAHAARNSRRCADIEAYWEEERATYQCAYELAQAWGVPHILTQDLLEESLAEVEHHALAALGVAALIGSRETSLVRMAEDQLRPMWAQWRYDLETWSYVVNGWGDSEEHFERLVDLERRCLRVGWRGVTRAPGDWGRLALPQTIGSARVLHSCLRRQAERASLPEGSEPEFGKKCLFVTVEDPSALPQAVRLVQAALVRFPSALLLASLVAYGDEVGTGTVRIYRLALDFEGEECDAAAESCRQEIWVLFAMRREEDLLTEAAWQRYLLSWRGGVQVRVDALHEGLRLVWQKLSSQASSDVSLLV